MSLTTTTLASAFGLSDTSVVVASATGISAGMKCLVDQESGQVVNSYVAGNVIVPILRGQDGSNVQAHQSGANITFGLGSDFANPGPQAIATYQIAGKARTLISYTAAGAITLPTPGTDMVAVINGTSTIAMTIAQPTKDMDGCLLIVVGNGKSASTVTLPTTGIGNAGSSYDVLTLQNAGQVGFILMAVNGFWVYLSAPLTGTSTALSIAIA